ncbi:transmembrane 4 L6 family member 1 [Microcaecilia unicolor]|uniref:Transmembrane 4 L6 family member 1 n=1 Tax=Microcaecilia unicolor TaxID=1415580 RepID=A0A6P7Z743_9AMPH|nr:transmembrane 4 L6 family member 1 [Microcaecilia unicolor]
MCYEKCAKGIGYNLLVLAVFCIVANILLYFPNGETKYATEDNLTDYVWYFHGIAGAGLLMLLPASVFIGLEHEDCCGCCGHANCGKRCAMLSSILAALIGLAGSGYCVIISALALVKGPYCYSTNNYWTYQFNSTNGGYLTDYNSWSQCTEPKHIVEWNVILFSILLGLAGIQFILCFIQILNGLIGGICGYCCSSSQQSYVC